jgi:DNA-binding HxlR family transcriptional regulator
MTSFLLAFCKYIYITDTFKMQALSQALYTMVRQTKIEWNGCPVRYAAAILGDKWTFVILRDCLLHGKRFFGEFADSEERIATNILTDRLAKLVQSGLLEKVENPRNRKKIVYLPTRKARDLLSTFLSMMVWSIKYDESTEAPKSFARSFNKEPSKTVEWYEDEIDRIDSETLSL